MKKSELIKKLNEIEGDYEICFAVDTDIVAGDDFNYWYTDCVESVKFVTRYREEEHIYTDREELENSLACRYGYPDISEEELKEIIKEKIKKMETDERIEIRITI